VKPSFHGRKCLALLLGPISALVLAGALDSSFASAEPYAPQTTTPIAALVTGAEVPVPPWCAWNSSIPENVLLSAVDDPSGIITYRGEIVDLAFSSDWNYTYVSGDVEINRTLFAAYIIVGGDMIQDPAMNFDLAESNPLTISRTLDPSCDDSGNSFTSGELITDLYQSSAPSVGLTVVPGASTLTNNFCKWKVDYAVKIPAGLEPSYTRANYAWIGPQLIYTLSFPVE